MPIDLYEIEKILKSVNSSGFKKHREVLDSLLQKEKIDQALIISLIKMLYQIMDSKYQQDMAKYLKKLSKEHHIDLFALKLDSLKTGQFIAVCDFSLDFCLEQAIEGNYLSNLVQNLLSRLKKFPEKADVLLEMLYKVMITGMVNDASPNDLLGSINEKLIKRILSSNTNATLLHRAINNKSSEWVEYLLNNFPNLIYLEDKSGQTPLIYAMKKKDYATAEALVKREASVYDKDITGKSALEYAKKSGDERLYKLFFAKQFAASAKEQTWVQAEQGKTFEIDQHEFSVVKDFVNKKLKRVNVKSRFYEYAKRFERRMPFKIPREILNDFQMEVKMQHSYLMLPDDNGGYHIAAMLRGTFPTEGIIAHGVSGKVLPILLEIEGQQYCVKVSDAISSNEQEIMRIINIKYWSFKRTKEERAREKGGWHDSAWIRTRKIGDKYYIIQKYIPGVELTKLLDKDSGILANRTICLQIAIKLASRLKEMHDVNVAHMDLHSGNCIVNYDKTKETVAVEIIDFDRAHKSCTDEDKGDDIVSLLKIMKKLGLVDIISELDLIDVTSRAALEIVNPDIKQVLPDIIKLLNEKMSKDLSNNRNYKF